MGDATKLTAPVAALIANRPASVPPSVYVNDAPASGSLAVPVYTVPVRFSNTVAFAALLTTGASFTLLTETLTDCSALKPCASVATTVKP